jgi:hypothetical protein
MRADKDSKKACTTDSSTQTVPKTSTTTSIGAQTYPTSTLPTTRDSYTQTDPTSTHTSPPRPSQPVTSPLPSLTQLPSLLPTTSTTITNVAPPAPTRRPTTQERRHSLPNNLWTAHLSPQLPVERPKPRCSNVTTLSKSAGPSRGTAPTTSTRAKSSVQATPTTSEATCQTADEVQGPTDVGKTEVLELRDDEHRYVPRHVVHPVEHPSPSQNVVQGSRKVPMSSKPQVTSPEPSCPTVTSTSTSVGLPFATKSQMTIQATFSARTTPTTSETTCQTVNECRDPRT